MDIRPCPRCFKRLPGRASFCRRCGGAMPHLPSLPPRHLTPHARTNDSPDRWLASFVAVAAIAALISFLAIFTATGRSVHQQARLAPPPDADSFEEIDPSPGATVSQYSLPSIREMPQRGGDTTAQNIPHGSGPRILAFAGPRAGFGHKVAIRGVGLGGVTRVLFVGVEGGYAEARFGALDDQRVLAVVPDMGPEAQDVLIVIVTSEGAAVSVSGDRPTRDSTFVPDAIDVDAINHCVVGSLFHYTGR